MDRLDTRYILDSLNERSINFKDTNNGLGTFELLSYKLYMNIQKVKTDVYSILSYKSEISGSEFLEIFHKYVTEDSQKDIVKDIIREVLFYELGLENKL